MQETQILEKEQDYKDILNVDSTPIIHRNLENLSDIYTQTDNFPTCD